MSAAWTLWDGRRLAWRGAGPAADLMLDGVRFAPAAPDGEYIFPLSPSANDTLLFELRGADGARAAPWRVRHGSAAAPGVDAWHGTPAALRPLRGAAPAAPRARVSIVVPIHNSLDCVQRCIESVLRWTVAPARLILIDDASSEPGIAVLLARHIGADGVVVRSNAQNLGYTRSTNLGIELAERDDVVLLNSDTEVGPRWLETLRNAAYAEAQRGTVTAVSDNAGAFSVPELEQYCPIPPRWTLAQAQRALLQHAGGVWPELPTGNGFCMYVKRALLDAVGAYDADAFPFGYGEENDLCQRAERAGWRHAIAGDVLVRHARSASFGHERRAALGRQGMAVLRERYPDYEAKVGATLFSFERRVLDWRVRRLYADAEHAPLPRPRLLLHGAACALAHALRERYACFALAADGMLRALDDETVTTIHTDDLAGTLAANAVEIVHGHGLDAALVAAAERAGAAAIDSADDASLVDTRNDSDNAWLAARCARRYAAAWRERAAWPEFCEAEADA